MAISDASGEQEATDTAQRDSSVADSAEKLKDKLLQKSLDSQILALETINRLSVQYRIDSFCILLCNSWELLLKAKIIKDSGLFESIYYDSSPDERPRTLSLSDALHQCIHDTSDPVRRNLEKVEEFRHEAMHLVISELPTDVMELFQSAVLNYQRKLSEWFDRSLREFVPEGMMWLMIEPMPIRKDLHVLLDTLGPNEINYLTKLQADLRAESRELGYTPEYMAVIRIDVGVRNKPMGGDVQLVGGSDGQATHIVHKTKDPADTHPLYRSTIFPMIQKSIPESIRFNGFSFDAICHVMNVRSHDEWHYRMNMDGARSQYSMALANHIIEKINENPGLVQRAESAFTAWKRSQGHYTPKSKRRISQ